MHTMAKSQGDTNTTAAALEKIHECIKRLRDNLTKSASLHATISNGTADGTQSNDPKTRVELEAYGQKMLTNIIATSTLHDSIIRNVETSRKMLGNDQEALLKVRLKLDNLTHQKLALQRQIHDCKRGESELLKKTNIPLPAVNTESDELASNAHNAITNALNEELKKRKHMRQLVESEQQQTTAKRRKLSDSKSELRELPRTIRSLSSASEPLRKLFLPNSLSIAKEDDLPRIHSLPGPLYILCRTALAYRETHGGVEVSAVGEPVTDNSRFETEKAADVYFMHPMQARIDITGDPSAPKLRITFRYHVNLRIVTVTSAIVVDGQETSSFSTKDLQMLYPLDFGEVSPNPNNDFIEEASFQFEVEKAQDGRPYLWANLVCGIPCLPRISPGVGALTGPFMEWPSVAARYPDHLRFKDVVETLRERLCAIVSLKGQIEALQSKKLPVLAQVLQRSGVPKAKVDEFVKLGPKDVQGDEDVSRAGTYGAYTEIWGMSVSRGELRIKCLIGLEPDYPVGAPVFRLKCAKGIPNISESDIVELERCVNEYKPAGEVAKRRDLMLGAQVSAFLMYIDNLVDVCESIDEGTVESGSGEIKGRTRSKRDAMLGQGSE